MGIISFFLDLNKKDEDLALDIIEERYDVNPDNVRKLVEHFGGKCDISTFDLTYEYRPDDLRCLVIKTIVDNKGWYHYPIISKAKQWLENYYEDDWW